MRARVKDELVLEDELDWLWSVPFLFLLVALYFSIFAKLVHDWYTLPDFSHGFIIPIAVGYVLWRRRVALRATRVVPSWNGLCLLVPGLLLLLMGVLGAELFLARISFVLVLGGAVWMLLGLPLLRVLQFPLVLTLLGIPLPQVVLNQVTLPLQLLASSLAAGVLPLLHVPVLREGNVIHLPAVQLEVAEACSGIRSLTSLFTLTVLYVYFADRTVTRRLLLVAASLPIAVLANALRIVLTGVLVQWWGPQPALGFFHEFSGLVLFCACLAMVVGLDTLLNRVGTKHRAGLAGRA